MKRGKKKPAKDKISNITNLGKINKINSPKKNTKLRQSHQIETILECTMPDTIDENNG